MRSFSKTTMNSHGIGSSKAKEQLKSLPSGPKVATTREKIDELKISMNKLDKLIQMEQRQVTNAMYSDEELTNDLYLNNKEKGKRRFIRSNNQQIKSRT